MDYISIAEMAKKWDISARMIRKYCISGRIDGTVYIDNVWMIPENAQKPSRRQKKAPQLPTLVKQLQRQRSKKVYHGLYDYIQTNFCYSSNRLASNRLMLNQVEEIYKKGKVSVGFEPIKVDDLIEAYNHLACVNYIIETATARLSQAYIRKLHAMIGYGTMAERKLLFRVGEYRKDACTLDKTKTTPPRTSAPK